MATAKQKEILEEAYRLGIITTPQYQEALRDSRYCYKLIGFVRDHLIQKMNESNLSSLRLYVGESDGVFV